MVMLHNISLTVLKVKSRRPQGQITRSTSDNTLLVIPPTRTQIGDKAFVVAQPSIYGTLFHATSTTLLTQFQTGLENLSFPTSVIFHAMYLLLFFYIAFCVALLGIVIYLHIEGALYANKSVPSWFLAVFDSKIDVCWN